MSVIRSFDAVISKDYPKYKIMVESYNSAMEVVEDCRKRKITDSMFDDMSKKSISNWEGVDSYDEALEYLHNGCQPIVEDLKKNMKKITGSNKRMTFRNNIVGYSPVVPLALKGVPNCMVDVQMKPIKAKVLDVYYDMTVPCGRTADEILEVGSKLLGIILELEQQGYKFNLYATQTYTDSKGTDVLTVKIKSSTQPFDLRRMSFPLAHPAFFRVIGFDWYSKTPRGRYRGGYGHALKHEFDRDEMKAFARAIWGDNSVYIDAATLIDEDGDDDYIKGMLLTDANKSK